jgi:hypothetical protein
VIQLLQDLTECLLDVVYRAVRVVLPLLLETPLALHELLAIEGRFGGTFRLPNRDRVSEEASYAVP